MERIAYSTLKNLCSISKKEVDDSFNTIFNKYRYLVYYVSYDVLKNKEDAEDIVNETFLKMYENRREFLNESKLKFFLLTTAKNLSFNRYKQKKDHLMYCDDIAGKNDDVNINIYLDKFKEVLDESEYQYLVLHLIYDFSFREIAKSNKLTTSQVSSKYQRGIKKLRDFYRGDFHE